MVVGTGAATGAEVAGSGEAGAEVAGSGVVGAEVAGSGAAGTVEASALAEAAGAGLVPLPAPPFQTAGPGMGKALRPL
jgi:hypothetical protein